MKRIVATLAVALIPILPLNPSTAHDLKGLLVESKKLAAGRIGTTANAQLTSAASPQKVRAFSLRTGISVPHANSVIVVADKWEVPRKLSICFFGGTVDLRLRIANAMMRQWPLQQLTAGRLQYDDSFQLVPTCDPSPQADIRVGFQGGDNGGYWSDIGSTSRLDVVSMNFEGFDSNPPSEPDFSRLVGHEMGHALGLHHEHQSPNAPTCKWNFPVIESAFGWSDQLAHANFDRLVQYLQKNDQPAYIASRYDQKSIMHYAIPAQYFLDANDPCYIPYDNEKPDQTDLKAIATMYSAGLIAQQNSAKAHLSDVILTLDPKYSALKKLLVNKLQVLNALH